MHPLNVPASPSLFSVSRGLFAWLGDRPRLLVELFVLVNFAGLVADIYLAHSMNHFEHWEEWIPFYFSIIAPPLLGVAILGYYWLQWRRLDALLGWLVGAAAVLIGIAGMILHLEGAFEHMTLKRIVYSAPFAAPLAYAGLGMLLILNRMEQPNTEIWARWVLLLAWGGLLGNFGLSLIDHAQIGFWEGETWISVVAAAIAVGFILVAAVMRTASWYLWVCGGVLALQVVVGLLGFWLHVQANLHSEGSNLWYKFVYGAPAFAPLLFPNIALLAAIGLWALARTMPPPLQQRHQNVIDASY
jgi:hypothetical protein